MATAGAAVAAIAARDVAFAGNAIADLEAGNLAADLDDLAAVFVPDCHRHRDRLLRPGVPVVDVHVRAADGAALHTDQNVVRTGGGFRDVLQFDADGLVSFDECAHRRAILDYAQLLADLAECRHRSVELLARVRRGQLRANASFALRHDRIREPDYIHAFVEQAL